MDDAPDDRRPCLRPGDPELSRMRAEMVADQLLKRGITDRRVVEAMGLLPRHRFVPGRLVGQAYKDAPLPIGQGQTISQPYMVALMTETLALAGGERVLEIGTGSGYQTAILARLAREVVTVERMENLSLQACETLSSLGIRNVSFSVADGSLGNRHRAPYDRILVTAGAPSVPAALVEQLADGGMLVVPVGSRLEQTLVRVRKAAGQVREERLLTCVFVPLVGEQGWDREDGPA